jgi:hypothetical protein
MRRISTFHLIAAVVVVLGVGSAVAAGLGATALGISLVGLALTGVAGLLVLIERRANAAARQTLRSTEHATRQSTGRILSEVQRVEKLVDAMQRRVVTSVESARIEAAERHRASIDAK